MSYHNHIRRLIDAAKKRGKSAEMLRHQIGVDEIHDPTLVSLRVYGNRHDYDVVMIAAGTSAIWQPLPQSLIYLPTAKQLLLLKKRYQHWGQGRAV